MTRLPKRSDVDLKDLVEKHKKVKRAEKACGLLTKKGTAIVLDLGKDPTELGSKVVTA